MMDLERLKYAELQKLAKEAGIKANMKSDRLRNALREYYTSETCSKERKTDREQQRAGRVQSRGHHKRRGTYDLDDEVSFHVRPEENSGASIRQSTEGIIDGMDTTAGDEAMKQAFLNVINKKVEIRLKDANVKSSASVLTKIPRFTRTAPQKDTSITPGNKNWAAIHKRQFDKMDSLDVYLEKKRQRTDALQSQPSLSDTLTKAIEKQRNYRTPDTTRGKSVQRKSTVAKSKLFPTPAASFKPTVLSTKEINVNFAGIKSAGFRFSGASMVAKPVVHRRKSPRVSCMRENTKSAQPKKVSIVTPGKDLAEPKSTKKATFNLQESLSRRLTWVPYTGKVKPIDSPKVSTHDTSYSRHQSDQTKLTTGHDKTLAVKAQVKEDRKFFKTPTLKNTKETRRADAAKSRGDKQFAEMMKRRGLVA